MKKRTIYVVMVNHRVVEVTYDEDRMNDTVADLLLDVDGPDIILTTWEVEL